MQKSLYSILCVLEIANALAAAVLNFNPLQREKETSMISNCDIIQRKLYETKPTNQSAIKPENPIVNRAWAKNLIEKYRK